MQVLIQLFILALIAAGALPAQDLTGIWQGTLQAPSRQLRTVIRISQDAGSVKAVLFSIDQPGAGVNATSVALQGSAVNIAIPGLAGNNDSRPDLFTAFQQQLGLKLESTKAVVDVLVIDHVEHPSEN